MSSAALFVSAVFWLCVGGALVAGVKHLLAPRRVMDELCPNGLDPARGGVLNPVLWWGAYAFSAMNVGLGVVGLWIGLFDAGWVGRQAILLGTGVLFAMFSYFWFTVGGELTGINRITPQKQGTKVGAFAVLFFVAFAASLSL